jgi:NTE family protein
MTERLPAPPRAVVPKSLRGPGLPVQSGRRIALALGGGGARGLAHVLALEALDELGVKPAVVAGTSIGAIYGAGYCSGLSGKHLRAHTEEVLGQRFELVRQLFSARAEPVLKFLSIIPIRPALLDPEALMEVVLPSKVARSFEELQIPFQVVATDFYAQEPLVFSAGPLRPAVAASMALPAIFTPVKISGAVLVDGGLVNPLPFDLVAPGADVTIAVDVSGNAPGTVAVEERPSHPSALEVIMGSSQIFQRSIVRAKLEARHPDVYVDCPVDHFSVIDFHRYREILAAAEPVKEVLKRQLGRILDSQPADVPEAVAPPPGPPLLPARGRKRHPK